MRYFILLFVLVILSCSSKPKDCSNFRTGTFKYLDSNSSSVITRNDSIQIEVSNKENKKIIGSIKWLSDCKYNLTYKEVSNDSSDKRIGVTIEVDIIEVLKEKYKYRAHNSLNSTTGWMIKIN